MIQWIKCSDQMPEEGAMVLTAFRGVVRTAVCKAVDGIGSKMFVSELDRCHGIPATHWAKSPKPPQE
ncbi:DUF551 domain-containing protein [Shigella phage Sf11 SMD-2017]|uniref:DUF551 domain-containing protein n=1 Tax=Shigella phage Sf11 SMD-2017 TaxID=2282196 RepID=A0A291AXG7_9CAUD|nr:DUF551 domain-containing protein [Shigella phage Sf11 SMD-2017]ATE85670.1 hypothetical protein Sf11_gp23 [Shigella phage Sf11 SMD-2017]